MMCTWLPDSIHQLWIFLTDSEQVNLLELFQTMLIRRSKSYDKKGARSWPAFFLIETHQKLSRNTPRNRDKVSTKPVTMGPQGGRLGEAPLENFSSPLEKCVGHNLKILNIVQKLCAPLGKLFAPPGVPSWLRAWSRHSPYVTTLPNNHGIPITYGIQAWKNRTTIKVNLWPVLIA